MAPIKKRSLVSAVLILALLLWACGCTAATVQSPGNTGVQVHYLDVGQGDSEFIELPNGKTLLIDAGNPDDGQHIISYIKALGYSTIDVLVATHPHADHIGGMAAVVKSFAVGAIYMPKVADTTATFEGLLTAIKAKGLQVNTARAGVICLDGDGVTARFLAPTSAAYDDLNNYSAVLKLTYGHTSFLFMGDAEMLSENELLKSGADVDADVLKVGHHGSTTSTGTDFLAAVSPRYAVVSVGAGNSYGHPHQQTLKKLAKISAQVYRTDIAGTISITSDSKRLTVTTEKVVQK